VAKRKLDDIFAVSFLALHREISLTKSAIFEQLSITRCIRSQALTKIKA